MMNGMMGGGDMWLMGLIGLLLTVLVVFGIVALAKYIFFPTSHTPDGSR
ncbi:MAG: hypothetical protein RID42_18055 [Alphaproteobacteria bacterium]